MDGLGWWVRREGPGVSDLKLVSVGFIFLMEEEDSKVITAV